MAATLSESHNDKKMASFEPDAVTAFQNVRNPRDTCHRQNSAPAPCVDTEIDRPWLTSAAIGIRTMSER
jgi:hypothetical protein